MNVRPTLAEARYRAALRRSVASALKAAYKPLLERLPELCAGSGIRGDAPGDEALDLIEDDALAGEARKIAAESRNAASNVRTHTRNGVQGQLRRSRDQRVQGVRLSESPELSRMAERFAEENVALIQGIAPKVAASVRQIVLDGFAAGTRHEVLARKIEERLEIGVKRAELIAIDQIGKLDGEMTAQRHKDIGITHFFWRTSQDERVRGNPTGKYPDARPSHYARAGQRYAYASPPIGRDGTPELPGVPYRCRCYADPDLSTVTDPAEQPNELRAKTVEEIEAEADAAVAEVEAMLAAQAAEFEAAKPKPIPDPVQNAAADMLASQFQATDPGILETAFARYRRWRRRAEQVRR